jgi:hypothetical protein
MYSVKFIFFSFLFFCFQISKSQDKWNHYIDNTSFIKSESRIAAGYYLLRSDIPLKNEVLDSLGFIIVRKLDAWNIIITVREPFGPIARAILGLQLFRTNNLWKLNSIKEKAEKYHNSEKLLLLKVNNSEIFKDIINGSYPEIRILKEFKPSNTFLIKIFGNMDSLLSIPCVTYAEIFDSYAFEEADVIDYNPLVNQVNRVHKLYPEINGQNINVSIKENRYDTADIDFKGRHIATIESSIMNSNHTTYMASIIAGGGNQSFKSKGIAWGANIASSDFNNLLPNSNEYFNRYDISVQNHSYGTQLENFYGALANAYDVCSNNNPSLLHVFSAGNIGQQTDILGSYKGVTQFANLTGNYKQAKNVITVGVCDLYNLFDTLVSRGPAYDGRIKPELVAFSSAGSSNAAAIVSGVIALMQQTYKLEKNDSLPASALIKAILINSAEDIGTKGVDFYTGYGNVNAYRAIQAIKLHNFISGKIGKGGVNIHDITLPPNARNLKVTLAWNDPAAQPGTYKALVNDLDLLLVNKNSGFITMPWTLNTYPHTDSLNLPAVQLPDHLNNLEQITLPVPEDGTYEIRVSAYDLPVGSQDYYIAYQWDENLHFDWLYPGKGDFMVDYLTPYSIFRWKYEGSETIGILEVKFSSNSEWNLISNNVELSKGYYLWDLPPEMTIANVCMRIGNDTFISDTFTISNPLPINIGFNCGDSVMLVWSKIPQAKEYSIYNLGEKYMEPIASLSDTLVIIKKKDYPTIYFAAVPVFENKIYGCRSYAYNYDRFGPNCYFWGFVAENLGNKSIRLSLELGTTYKLRKVNFEHWEAGFKTILADSIVNAKYITAIHNNPTHGLNIYRAGIELDSGIKLYAAPDTIYYIFQNSSLIFPNPARSGSILNVYMPYEKGESAVITLYDLNGKAILSDKFTSDFGELRLTEIKKGIYIYQLVFSNFIETGKLLVL